MRKDYDFSTPPCMRCGHSFIEHKMVTENGAWPTLGRCLFPSEADDKKTNPEKCVCRRFVHATSHYTTGEIPMEDTWFNKVRDGRVKTCPVCDGRLEVYNPLNSKHPIWYECVDCEWNDEIQDLCDMGWQAPGKGWPKVMRTCILCAATSDGTALPSVEVAHCRCGAMHTVCKMKGLPTPPGCEKAVFGRDAKKGYILLDVCPVGNPDREVK